MNNVKKISIAALISATMVGGVVAPPSASAFTSSIPSIGSSIPSYLASFYLVDPQAEKAAAAPAENVTVDGVELTSEESKLLDLINDHREDNGLAPLKVDQNLTDKSRAWSQNQAEKKSLYHSRSNVTENVAENSSGSPEFFFKQWLNSPSHNKNMLEPRVSKVGCGVATGGDRHYATLQLQ